PIRFFQLFKIVFTSVLLLMYSIKVSFFYWVVHLLVAIIPLECLFTFYVSYRLYCQKDATARYFIFGSTILYIGILTNLTYYLLTGKHLPPPDGLHVGLFLEILLFSLGLGHRMNLNEREKQKAQQELIRQLQENERLQASIKEELEEKVRERTLEIEKQNQAILLQSEELKAKQEEILQQAEQLRKVNEEIKKVNANLEFLVAQRTADLKRANKELDLFLYRSSHDLRGPLTTLLGLVELGYLTHREQDAFNILEKVKIIVQNMDKTLEKLQMISEIDIAHKKDTTYLDFKTLLHQLLERFHPLIQERKIKVEKHLELHEPFETHPNLVRIILYNLIENAIMFSYPSDPFVKIYISTKKGILFMQVVDNGIGIPEGFREKIFDMYVRASETSKGNGLGLYVTKRAVLKLGGKIYLDNEIPKTMRITKFNVEIPKMPKNKLRIEDETKTI
ncbi:MAG: sensor histidine kinase, partial [Flammeovirgaceae bacterium]|nr:sensor histidine kinase [Flammeovirgaceae bacterium]